MDQTIKNDPLVRQGIVLKNAVQTGIASAEDKSNLQRIEVLLLAREIQVTTWPHFVADAGHSDEISNDDSSPTP